MSQIEFILFKLIPGEERCTGYAVVKWADYTLKPGRYFAFEDSNGCLRVATIFSLLSVGSAYFVAFRIFTEFTISDGSVHVTKKLNSPRWR